MSAGGEALLELLAALAPPLEYLAATNFTRAARVGLPLDALAERIARARGDQAGDLRGPLSELDEIIGLLRGASPEDRADLLRRAHALLPVLRGAAETAGAPAVAEAADVDAALGVLGLPVERIAGVGPKRAAELSRFGLVTVEDVLWHLPFRYEDWRTRTPLSALRPGDEVTAVGAVEGTRQGFAGRRGRQVLEVVLRDGAGSAVLVWFNQVQYFAKRFREGQRLVVHGRVEPGLGMGPPRLVHPDVTVLGADDDPDRMAPIVPVYEKPTAMPVGVMRRIVQGALGLAGDRVPAAIPLDVARRQRLVPPSRALRHVHSPPATADLAALASATSLAHRSLIFDELFFLQLGLALRRNATVEEPGTAFPDPGRLTGALRAALPFALTAAQERAIGEIAADVARPHPMRRLLQGDVGSGKTLVALLAALVVIDCGWQAALMAPTELLAEQHLETVRPWLAPLGVEAVLLTGSVKGQPRRRALADLAAGRIALAVGTHALIQEGVEFARLGLAIVDEQHRFGVLQRAALQRRGSQAAVVDVLVMSATPIPRTLALTLYGDLAVSTLDELPPGRTRITTTLCRESQRGRLTERLRAEVAAGHQAYVVYPLVEESEKSDLRAATTMVHELAAGSLAGLLDLVHGRMAAMRRTPSCDASRHATSTCSCRHRHRGGDRCAERHRDRDRACRAFRTGAAAPAAWTGRARDGTGTLLPGRAGLAVAGRLPAPARARVHDRRIRHRRGRSAAARPGRLPRHAAGRAAAVPRGEPPRDTALLRAAREDGRAGWRTTQHSPDRSRPRSARYCAIAGRGGWIWRRWGEERGRNSQATSLHRHHAGRRPRVHPARSSPGPPARLRAGRLSHPGQRSLWDRCDLLLSQLPRGGPPRSVSGGRVRAPSAGARPGRRRRDRGTRAPALAVRGGSRLAGRRRVLRRGPAVLAFTLGMRGHGTRSCCVHSSAAA
jgi:ATP-dependent DNA helicase RecG